MRRRALKGLIAAVLATGAGLASWRLFSDLQSASSPQPIDGGSIMLVADTRVTLVKLWLDVETEVPGSVDADRLLLRFAFMLGWTAPLDSRIEVVIAGPIAESDYTCRSPIAQPVSATYSELSAVSRTAVAEHYTDLIEKEAASESVDRSLTAAAAADRGLRAASQGSYSKIEVANALTQADAVLPVELDRAEYPFVVYGKIECDVPMSALWSRTELGAVLSTPNVAYATLTGIGEQDVLDFVGDERIVVRSNNDVVLRDSDPIPSTNDGSEAAWRQSAGKETFPSDSGITLAFGNHDGIYARFEEIDSSETRDVRLFLLGVALSVAAAALIWFLDTLLSD